MLRNYSILFCLISVIIGSNNARESCGVPAIPYNGFISPEMENFNVGNSARFHCKQGFILIGEKDNICLGDGIWKEEFPLCSKNLVTQIEEANERKHSTKELLDDNSDTCINLICSKKPIIIRLNETLQLREYHLSITFRITENEDYKIPKILVSEKGKGNNCEFEILTRYMNTTHLYYTMTCGNNSVFKSMSTKELEFKCEGTQNINICEISLVPHTDQSKCGIPQKLPHCEVNTATDENIAHYSAKSGFYLVGNSTLECVNGKWTGLPPKCEGENVQRLCERQNKEFNITSVVLGISLFLTWCILGIVVAYYKKMSSRTNERMKNQISSISFKEMSLTKQNNRSNDRSSSSQRNYENEESHYEEINSQRNSPENVRANLDEEGYLMPKRKSTSAYEEILFD